MWRPRSQGIGIDKREKVSQILGGIMGKLIKHKALAQERQRLGKAVLPDEPLEGLGATAAGQERQDHQVTLVLQSLSSRLRKRAPTT